MTRLFWYAVIAAVVAVVVAGISWTLAQNTVNDVLGDPPPEMGKTQTTFLWDGMPRMPEHPRAWRFAYSPTRIPGAPTVRIYVSPMGHLLQTEPRDLMARVTAMHGKGFN
jgi:hypothetical protein